MGPHRRRRRDGARLPPLHPRPLPPRGALARAGAHDLRARHLVLAVGRRAACPLIDAQDLYLRRLGAWAEVTRVWVRPSDPRREAAALLARLPPGARVTVLDGGGHAPTTSALAERLGEGLGAGRPWVWVVGGAFGLDPRVSERAEARWSLSPLTLPHRLAAVVLLEQLYRAHTVLAKAPYHHA